jgi:Uma2 family endonuclease
MIQVDRWTTADLARLPDDDGMRYEIIDGELHVPKAPHSYHQVVAGRIPARLDTWGITHATGLTIAAPGIVLDDEDNLIPDVIWISNARLAMALGEDGKLHALPELVVEVLSPGAANERRDREDKRLVYGRGGVQEYWIVDWQRRTLEVYRLNGNDLTLTTSVGEADTLQSDLLPDLAMPMAPLCVGVPHV